MLTRAQRFALSREVDATSTLFRHGFAILDEYKFAARDAEAVFVCLAGGSEKLLKLTVGLFALEAGDPWPSKATMRTTGHKITELDGSVRALIAEHQHRTAAHVHIAELLERVNENPGVSQILQTLERYALYGRFWNLDSLGGVTQPDEPPLDLWEELHSLVYDANPDLMEESAYGDYVAARRAINRILGLTLGSWCELIVRAWRTGVCGAEASKWCGQLELGYPLPRRRQPAH